MKQPFVALTTQRGAQAGPRFHIPASYIAEASPRLAKLGGWPSEEVAQIVREYDPELEVVFIFLRLDGDVFHYLVSDELTPPQADQAKTRS